MVWELQVQDQGARSGDCQACSSPMVPLAASSHGSCAGGKLGSLLPCLRALIPSMRAGPSWPHFSQGPCSPTPSPGVKFQHRDWAVLPFYPCGHHSLSGIPHKGAAGPWIRLVTSFSPYVPVDSPSLKSC
ncbi:hypothetical protein H1C71_042037 [Ictidomys tridecemlineatus]|nr:hypothetical protein H1C71_042037 [Ictidomys tridecemlineatus]